MSAPAKPAPWSELTSDQKRELVFPLIEDGKTYSQIAPLVGAPSRSSIAQVVYGAKQSGKKGPRTVSVSASRKKNIRGGKPSLNAIRALRKEPRAKSEEEGTRVRRAPACDAESRPTVGGGTHGANVSEGATGRRDAHLNSLSPTNILHRAEVRKKAPGLTITAAAAFDPLPNVEPVRLVDHQEPMCRWPVETDTTEVGHFFCSAPRDGTSPYCAAHRILSLPEYLRNQEVA